jgi:hypothetical protein
LTLGDHSPLRTSTIAEVPPPVEARPASLAWQADARLASIDVLRGFAALAVVLYHARAEYWIGVRQTWSLYGFSGGPDIWRKRCADHTLTVQAAKVSA